MMDVAFELATVRMNTKELVNQKVGDIQFRLQAGIYATDNDETAEQVHDKLVKLQQAEESSMSDFAMMDTYVRELEQRGYFRKHYAHGGF